MKSVCLNPVTLLSQFLLYYCNILQIGTNLWLHFLVNILCLVLHTNNEIVISLWFPPHLPKMSNSNYKVTLSTGLSGLKQWQQSLKMSMFVWNLWPMTKAKLWLKHQSAKKCVWKQQLVMSYWTCHTGQWAMRTVFHKLTTSLITFMETNRFWNYHQESFLSVGQLSLCHCNWRSSLLEQSPKMLFCFVMTLKLNQSTVSRIWT